MSASEKGEELPRARDVRFASSHNDPLLASIETILERYFGAVNQKLRKLQDEQAQLRVRMETLTSDSGASRRRSVLSRASCCGSAHGVNPHDLMCARNKD